MWDFCCYCCCFFILWFKQASIDFSWFYMVSRWSKLVATSHVNPVYYLDLWNMWFSLVICSMLLCDTNPFDLLFSEKLIYNNIILWCLCLHQADIILCAKEVTRLQSDLVTRMTLLRETVHTNTTVPTSHVFVSDFCHGLLICLCWMISDSSQFLKLI